MRAFDSCKDCKHRKPADDNTTVKRIVEICTDCKRCYVRGSTQAKTLGDLYKSE